MIDVRIERTDDLMKAYTDMIVAADPAGQVAQTSRRERKRSSRFVSAAEGCSITAMAVIGQQLPRSKHSPPSSVATTLRAFVTSCRNAWVWLQARRRWPMASRRLSLCETIALGEKRFLAIVKVDDQQFLIGGAAGTVSLLTQLKGHQDFAAALRRSQETGRSHP